MVKNKRVIRTQTNDTEMVLVGCGGKLTKPKCMYKIELKVYGRLCIVPVLVVPGQRDDPIIGTNVIKFLIRQLKNSDDHWRLISSGSLSLSPECEQFLDLMASTSCWRGEELPDKIGTSQTQAVSHSSSETSTSFGVCYPVILPCHLEVQ